jgi:hypothetical protein
VELAKARDMQIAKKTDNPPDLVAFDLCEERLVMGSIILLLEKTEKM